MNQMVLYILLVVWEELQASMVMERVGLIIQAMVVMAVIQVLQQIMVQNIQSIMVELAVQALFLSVSLKVQNSHRLHKEELNEICAYQ